METVAAFLTAEQVQRIHEASLEILAHVGLLVRNEKARQRLTYQGCHADPETLIVRFPQRVVEEFIKAVPATLTFYARDPQ